MITKSQITIAIAAALALLFYWGLRPAPVPVDIAAIKKGDLTVSIDEEGVTRIKEIYSVSAPISGTLRRLPLKAGDSVLANETIVAVIEPLAPAFQDVRSLSIARAGVKSAEAALTLAKAELTRVEAEFEFAQNEYVRMARLYKKRIIARKVYDQAQSEQRSAKANVSAALAHVEVRQKELESAHASLIQPGNNKDADQDEGSEDGAARECCLTIKAPIDGRVLTLKHKSQSVVTAGKALMEVGDDRDLEVVVELLSTDAVKITAGAEALIEGWGGNKALPAKVRRVEPSGFTKVSALGIEEQRVKVVLDLIGAHDEAASLGHDFSVFTRIKVWEGKDRLLVPLSALFRKGQQWHVFVFNGGVASLRQIELGQRNRQFAEVVKGLEEGEQVLLHPSDRVEDQVRIVSREDL